MPEWEGEIDWTDEQERVDQVMDWYNLSAEADADWYDRAKESYDFYFGETWDPEEIQTLNDKGAPALSINRIQSKVNFLQSMSRMNRYEPRAKAETSAADEDVAKILTHVMRHVNAKTDQDYIETMQFFDSIVCGRGYFAGDISYDKNFFGDIVTRYVPPLSIKFDPTALMPDLSDAGYIMEERWFGLDALASNWKLRDTAKGRKKLAQIMGRGESDSNVYADDYFVDADMRRQMGQYKVIECSHRRYETMHFIVELKTGIIHLVPNEETGMDIVAENPDKYFLTDAFRSKVQVTVVCMGIELYHGDSPFRSPIIPIFPLFCFQGAGRQDGIVQAMKDPQLETNKRRSQMLHLINQHANMVWIVDEDGLVHGVQWLKEHATEPGLVIEKHAGAEVRREVPGDFPMGLVHLENLASRDFHDVLGTSPESMPTSSMGAGASGRAIALRQQQGNTIVNIPMDNQRLTRRQYGRWLLTTVQEYYTTERVFRIEGEEGKDEFLRVNGRTSGGVINDLTVGDYDVVITDEPLSPSNRAAMNNMLMELAHQGVPIPPDILIRYSDVPDKDEITQRMVEFSQQQAGAEAPRKGGRNGSRG